MYRLYHSQYKECSSNIARQKSVHIGGVIQQYTCKSINDKSKTYDNIERRKDIVATALSKTVFLIDSINFIRSGHEDMEEYKLSDVILSVPKGWAKAKGNGKLYGKNYSKL